MIIGSKAAINEKQLLDRKEKGSNWFEVHTDYRDIINLKETISKKNILEKIGLKPYCIHAPMYDENKCYITNVEHLLRILLAIKNKMSKKHE
jgi:hypothetical protein